MFTKAKASISFFLSAIITLSGTILPSLSSQVKTIESLTEISDGFYIMDCTYDYDIDKLMNRGIGNHLDLLLYGARQLLPDSLFSCGFACTTFNARNPQGEYLFGRNFDYTYSPSLLVWTHPENGYASIGMTCLELLQYKDGLLPDDEFKSLLTLLAPYACVDGMNEKGLCVGIVELETEPTFQISLKKNLTTSTMVRVVLDKAATVEEAVKIFSSYDMRDFLLSNCTYHYQIADANGKSAVIEYVDGEMKVIYPEHSKKAVFDYQTIANYYLTPGVDDPLGCGQERTAYVKSRMDKARGILTEKGAMSVLKGVSMDDDNICGFICDTLWSGVYNTHDLTLSLCVSLDYGKTYRFSVKKPMIVK